MRRFDELPRMDADTKASILGVAAAGAVAGKRMSKTSQRRATHSHTAKSSPSTCGSASASTMV